MKSVGEFWFRIGIGAALLLIGLLVSLAMPGGGILFFILGIAQLAWTVISAQLTVRKAQKIDATRR